MRERQPTHVLQWRKISVSFIYGLYWIKHLFTYNTRQFGRAPMENHRTGFGSTRPSTACSLDIAQQQYSQLAPQDSKNATPGGPSMSSVWETSMMDIHHCCEDTPIWRQSRSRGLSHLPPAMHGWYSYVWVLAYLNCTPLDDRNIDLDRSHDILVSSCGYV